MWWSTVGVIVTLTLRLLVAPLAVEAQPAKVPRIGVLAVESGIFVTPERALAEFREALRERGYVEGQNVLIDYRSVAAGQTERLNDLAVELVGCAREGGLSDGQTSGADWRSRAREDIHTA